MHGSRLMFSFWWVPQAKAQDRDFKQRFADYGLITQLLIKLDKFTSKYDIVIYCYIRIQSKHLQMLHAGWQLMPFLNCIEQVSQDLLINLLPKLCSEWPKHTFIDYHVEWTHMKIKDNAPESYFDPTSTLKGVHPGWERSKTACSASMHVGNSIALSSDQQNNPPTANKQLKCGDVLGQICLSYY